LDSIQQCKSAVIHYRGEYMKSLKIALSGMVLIILLAGCELVDPISYNNPYAGDWYELEVAGNQWNAVKLSLSDSTFEISTTTFNADGENPGGYTGVSKGDVRELSNNQISMETTEKQISGNWFSRDEYVDDLVKNYGFTQIQAELQADIIFIAVTVSYSIGSDPTSLILGTGTGSGTAYTEMTYYTSVFSAKSLAH